MTRFLTLSAMLAAALVVPSVADAAGAGSNVCNGLPSYSQLQTALRASVKASGGPSNGGLNFHMWASIVALDGTVCAVTFSGQSFTDQWLGSRVMRTRRTTSA